MPSYILGPHPNCEHFGDLMRGEPYDVRILREHVHPTISDAAAGVTTVQWSVAQVDILDPTPDARGCIGVRVTQIATAALTPAALGGPRPGAGRPPEPRLSPADTRALLDQLAAGSTIADLARHLGLTRQALDKARRRGLSVRKSEGWVARLRA